jgi:hypothetical protein
MACDVYNDVYIMAMVRKQIYIEQEQDEALKRLAEVLGVSEAEVVRRAVMSLQQSLATRQGREVTYDMSEQQYLRIADREADDRLSWSRADIYKDVPRRLDDKAWEEELAFIEEIGRTATGDEKPIKWNREDAYDKRRLRLPD